MEKRFSGGKSNEQKEARSYETSYPDMLTHLNKTIQKHENKDFECQTPRDTSLMVSTLQHSFPYQGIHQMQDQHAVPQVYDQMTACTKGETLEIPKSLAPAKSEAFYKTLFQGNNKLQKRSSLLSSSGSTLITLSLI